ncbi:lysophospholipid acyltransferase family protein [Treponema sp.]
MRLDAPLANFIVRFLVRKVCTLKIDEMRLIPARGPAILAMNHINFLEAPLFGAFLFPRPLAALSKKENVSHPIISYFARIWNAIPVDRGGAASEALRASDTWLAKGGLLGLAPEGTRSRTGVLGQGKAGIAIIAHRAGVPVWPIGQWGSESLWSNLKKFKRTPVRLRVGRPFMIEPVGGMTRSTRQEVADEIMGRIAILMPERYRGPYAVSCHKEPKHLRFLDEAE